MKASTSMAFPTVSVRDSLTSPTLPVEASSAVVWPVTLPDLRSLPCAAGGEQKSTVAINSSSAASARRSSPKPSWVRSSGVPAVPCGSWASALTVVSSDVGRQ